MSNKTVERKHITNVFSPNIDLESMGIEVTKTGVIRLSREKKKKRRSQTRK